MGSFKTYRLSALTGTSKNVGYEGRAGLLIAVVTVSIAGSLTKPRAPWPFSLLPRAWRLPLPPLPRHRHPFVTTGGRSTGQIKVTPLQTAANAVNAKLPHTSAKKTRELKDEELRRRILVAHDPVHVAGLRQRCDTHNLGRL